MHSVALLLATLAAACTLLAGYTWSTRGEPGVPGLLVLLALVFASQAYRLKKWARRLDER